MIEVLRPYAFLFFLLLIPVVFFVLYRYKKISKFLSTMYLKGSYQEIKSFEKIRLSVLLRTVFRVLTCCCVILAFAGLSWGTKTIPVQKSGDAVSLVFDISYSMMAKDAPDGLTRLEAAKRYAWSLLDRMEGESISVILAKGDGVIAVPLTGDRASIDSILDTLSPSLMSSAGSSIGKGILTAMRSFPKNTSQASHIWVFTDGDETDSSLQSALDDAARFGFPVTMIGFGTARPIEVIAGDGKTKVKTYLNASKMIDAAASSMAKIVSDRKNNSTIISYIAADSESSAWILLKQLSGKTSIGDSYEIQTVPHHQLFILLAIIFFLASYFASEFDLSHILKLRDFSFLVIIGCCFMFSSCSSQKTSVLSGTFSWYQKKYQSATADFLRTYNKAKAEKNEITGSYCAYNLASTYIMQEEYDAAVLRLEQTSPDCDKKLKSAVFYNYGIIANRKGDFEKAEEYFKKAVIEDSSNVDARINLEFTQQQIESRQSKSAEKQMSSVSINKEQDSLTQAVFNLIQQEEKERWQKLQSNKKESSSVDY